MKYKDVGFRAIYKNFCAFPMRDNYKKMVKDYPDIDKADYLLCYGYIDREAGVTLEVLAGAKKHKDSMTFFDTYVAAKAMIRIGFAEDDEFYLFDDEDGSLKKRYASKLEILSGYEADEEVEKSRTFGFLDSQRHPYYPDDIQVRLCREDLKIEICWTRIIGLGDHFIMGTLLNEPDQDFGYHMGEMIAFFVNETEDKKVICYSDMNPTKWITPEDLEDGSMLKKAIAEFNANRNQENLISVMEILRDSYLWVPCNCVLSDADYERIEKMVQEKEDNLDSIVGTEFKTLDETRFIPDILQNGDDFYFPAFITDEDMGEYGNGFSKIQKHMLEIILLARNNEKKVKGIVINAFTEPFVLDAQIFDILENMKSRIKKEK